MKKILLFFILAVLVIYPSFADESYIIEIPEDERNISYKESYDMEKAFLFITGFEAILQDRVPGAILVLNESDQSFHGWATSITPQGFLDSFHSENITVGEIMPCDVVYLFFETLNDTSTLSFLKQFEPSQLLYCVVIFRPDKDFKPINTDDFIAQEALYNSITGHGMNKESFFEIANFFDLKEQDLLNVIKKGDKSPSEVVEDVLNLRNSHEDNSHTTISTRNVYFIIVLITFLIVLLVILVIRLSSLNSKNDNKKE